MQNKEVVVVFGAAGGLGKSLAYELSQQNVTLVLVDKNIKKLQEIQERILSNNSDIVVAQLDLEDTPKIYELANVLYEKYGHIDYLISVSAILGEIAPIAHFDTKLWNKVININLNANSQIIKAFNPLLLAAKAKACAIFAACKEGSGKAYWGAYAVSKRALEELVKIYAKENAETNISVSLFDPNVMNTHLRYRAMPGEDLEKHTSPEKVARFFVEKLTKNLFSHGSVIQYDDKV